MESLTSVVSRDLEQDSRILVATDMVGIVDHEDVRWVDGEPSPHSYSLVVILSGDLADENKAREAQTLREVVYGAITDDTAAIAEVELMGHGQFTSGEYEGDLVTVGIVEG